MPATSRGIDVFPGDPMPVDFREVAQRLKDNGTSVRMGQQVMITKVLIKGSSHIELHVGGGGFGTFGDFMSSSSESTATDARESAQEKALRDQIRQTTDREQRKKLERELDALRSARERENARARAEASQANEAREANLRTHRVDAGSRFNIRYRHGLPADALTPEGIERALAGYVDFGESTLARPAVNGTPPSTPSTTGGGVVALRKGLSIREVEALLGPAITAAETAEGSLTALRRTYEYEGVLVTATFVSDVLIDFAIRPK
jgi:hypothetical protein